MLRFRRTAQRESVVRGARRDGQEDGRCVIKKCRGSPTAPGARKSSHALEKPGQRHAQAFASPCSVATVSVREDNARAIALYRRRGFEATGEREPDEDHTGAAVEELVFRRPL
jgi:hypothetical protein